MFNGLDIFTSQHVISISSMFMQIRVCYERKAENSLNRLPVFLQCISSYIAKIFVLGNIGAKDIIIQGSQ